VELAQALRQPNGAEAHGRRDAQLAGWFRRRVGEQRLGRVQLVDHVRGRAVQQLALLGEHKTTRVPMEQRHLQVALES
jgi:hypothetical protein